ncbi:MMPL family transporter [Corynebacterium casei]|uniref:MMPL family transporter n=2 Tax=Corynebacterium casei TaxID=160386 RepID=UPI0026478C19|nr:MMPL family transporter [Corynebacterium casei]MDN5800011.1 MMPL family transporter [Corynebacterium casei]MDN5840402.1 MMPL family transporter [Corynebacterium casei]MDN5883800.1 MMPL family transporter [Corynebacterium casei]MDN5902396.1 MMPL family transporter [Corynebacterium casei]MDN5922459.1 MMPL family transporter [Corynebacterium casei]
MKLTRIASALVLVIIWFIIAGLGGPTFGKISDVSTNDRTTFLPASSESTQVSELTPEFSDSQGIPAIIAGETSDVGEVDLTERLESTEGVIQVIGPTPSEDSQAVQYIALIDTESADATEVVQLLSDEVADDGFYVTGPAGFSADLANAFAGIDGILLLVALAAVLVILIAVYRAVLLPFIVILTAVGALCAAIVVIYYMAKADIIVLNGQSQGILSILVIGAATDYSLLMVARQREELQKQESVADALKSSWKASFGAITASAATVAIALLCLLVSDLNSNRSLGPIAATGIFFAWVAALTLLPALLYLFGRASFWPAKPKFTGELTSEQNAHKFWYKVANFVQGSPRKVWAGTLVLLFLGAAWVPLLNANGVSNSDILLSDTEAKQGQEILNEHFDAGSGSPAQIIAPEELVGEVTGILENHSEISAVTLTSESGAPANTPPMNLEPNVVDGNVYIQATLNQEADSLEAQDTIAHLREEFDAFDGRVLVGGESATALDTNLTAERDLRVIVPLVLAVVLVVLIILLRAVLLPVLLLGATVISFGAAMGVSALVFNGIFNFPGADPTVPLYGFIFLVALGVDYTIFLMTRAKEDTPTMGTRKAVLHSLAVTGGVITSAGVVLAATFAALAVIPLMFMVQLAFIVAFGVLVDTFIVRTLLIPGLVLEIGPKVWWPSKQRKEKELVIAD